MNKSKPQESKWLAQGHTVRWSGALNRYLFWGAKRSWLAWKIPVYACCPSLIINRALFTSQKCSSLDDKLYGHPIVLANSSPILPLLTFKCGAVSQMPRRLGMGQAWVNSVCSYRALFRLLSSLIAFEYPFHPKDRSSLVHTQTQRKLKFL